MSRVDLGFAEKCAPWQVESNQFPSKIGGKPAWLDLGNLPPPEKLQCDSCTQPLIFLCQIYAPFEEDPLNFHRTLFIFICKNPKCCIQNTNCNVKVFRSVLQRENRFYSSEPPQNIKNDFALSQFVNLCQVCGALGPKQCAKCQKARYCSREHQVIDWKEGHKSLCHNGNVSKLLFREFEIVIEAEELNERNVNESEELEKFEVLKSEGKCGSLSDVSASDMEKYAVGETDKEFARFKKRISGNEDQILRYERGGQPLWIANAPKPDVIPDCEFCSSPRQFELQIMPQLLSVLHEHELDIGILVIYTCRKSCTQGGEYKKEVVFKQDVSQ